MPHRTQPLGNAPETGGTGPPDPTGLVLAQAVQAAVQPDTVILFGSRARGDHRTDSDVDLLILCRQDENRARSRAQKAIRDHFEQRPPRLPVDVVTMTREKFDYCWRAKNHVAGQAWRDGVIMNDERLNYSGNYEEDYPESWPDVKERLRAAYRHMGAFAREMDHPDGEQEIYGFHAQQAVENALKGSVKFR